MDFLRSLHVMDFLRSLFQVHVFNWKDLVSRTLFRDQLQLLDNNNVMSAIGGVHEK